MTEGRAMQRQARCGSAGFTLVELLVVIAIFGLLSVILFGGFRFATRTVTAGTVRLDHTEQLALVTGFLRRELADVRPFPVSAKAVAFTGEANAIRFIAAPPTYLAPGGFHALRIAAENSGQLVLRWEAMPDDATEEAPAIRPSVLLDGVTDAAFAYFGAVGVRRAPDWQDDWDGARGLPLLIRLRLTFADRMPAPDIVVAARPAVAASR
jgi:general secretion pathway protein J